MTRYATLLIIIALTLTFSIAQSLHWTQILPATSSRPPARDNGALAWTPSALYVFGGEGVDGVLGDTWKFSLFNNSWTELSFTTKPSARYGFLAGKLGNDYWYISHGRYDNDVFSDTWAFHFDSKTWTQVNTTGENGDSQSVPEARYFAAGGSNVASLSSNDTTGSLWLSMGINKASRKLSDTWILTINFSNPLQGVWKKVSNGVGLNQYNPTLPHARSQAAGIPFSEGRFVLSGGCASGGQAGGPCPLQDSWVFDSSNNLWSRLPSCTIPALSSSLVPLNLQLSDIAVLYGGTQKGPGALSQALSATPLSDDELTLINISSLQWIRINVRNTSSLLPTVRSGSQLTTGALGVYMFGGKAITNDNLLNDVWLLQGDGSNVEVISCTYTWFSSVHLHGIIMYIAWGLLLPFGALMGRYYRWSWPVWFAIHIPCQVIGTLLTFGGFILIFLVSTQPSFPHGVIGTILTAIIAQQFLTGIFRPCATKENGCYLEESKNKDTFKYKWRQCWEVYHAVSGIISIALGFTQVTLGVFLINAPSIVWAVWVGLLCLWLLVFLFHEICYWCFKKYLND